MYVRAPRQIVPPTNFLNAKLIHFLLGGVPACVAELHKVNPIIGCDLLKLIHNTRSRTLPDASGVNHTVTTHLAVEHTPPRGLEAGDSPTVNPLRKVNMPV